MGQAPGEDRPVHVVQVEDRLDRHQIHARLVVGVECPHVPPVPVVPLGLPWHLVEVEVVYPRLARLGEQWDDVPPHVVLARRRLGVGAEGVHQRGRGEDVVAHRGEGACRVVGHRWRLRRLLQEALDLPGGVGVDDPKGARLLDRYRNAPHGDACARVDVGGEHLTRIEPVDVIGPKHDHVIGILVVDDVEVLVDGVGRPGEPMGTSPHLRRDRGHIVPQQRRQPPGLGDMPVEAVAHVLGEHHYPSHVSVDQVGEHEVDQSVEPPERDRRLGPVPGQRVEPLPLAPGEHDRNNDRLPRHPSEHSDSASIG